MHAKLNKKDPLTIKTIIDALSKAEAEEFDDSIND